MSMKNRIIDFAKSQKMSIREFERVCNFPNGTIGAFKDDINNKRRLIIFEKFPQLNTKWLLTGEGEMLNHSHNEATYNTQKNNGGDNIYINNNGGNISNSGNTTGQQEAPGQHNGQGQEIKEMTKLLNQLHETKIIEIDRLTKLYNGIITNQNEFIDTLKEQNSQYRKEIECLKQRIKGNTENNKE